MVYLQDIKFTNFKCFEETQNLEFGKLTLLTGANSTGKSSLMYGILGVLQSKNFPLELSPNGSYVQMGNFLELVFKHKSDKTVGIHFTLIDSETKDKLKIESSWQSNPVGNPFMKSCECIGSFYSFRIETNTDGQQMLCLDIDSLKSKKKLDMEDLLEDTGSKYPSDGDLIDYLKYATRETHIKNVLIDGISGDTSPEIRYPLFLVLQETMAFIKRYNARVNYISSYRQPAQRIYTEEPVASGKIATSGEGFINELLKWKDEKQDKFIEFVEGMKSIGLLSDVKPTRLGSGQFKIGVKVHEEDEMANLWDVGFGISQTMPIIIGDVELGKESTLYVSQPEVHLHPKAQASFGDYLVKQVNNGKRYVIETHSEYLMNRLRLSIVRGNVKEDDVKVYYMSQKEGKTCIDDIKFKRDGQIVGAPQDFFDTYMIDVMDIAMSVQ